MEKLVATDKVKAIGVSNYSKKYLEQLLPEATVIPAVNQIENHPSLPQQEIVDFCKEKGIIITAYSPLGSTGGPLFTAEPIVEIAKKKNISLAIVLLSWHSTSQSLPPIFFFVCTFLHDKAKNCSIDP
jgi:glycerol 2-dehydrogenase (NADP+)